MANWLVDPRAKITERKEDKISCFAMPDSFSVRVKNPEQFKRLKTFMAPNRRRLVSQRRNLFDSRSFSQGVTGDAKDGATQLALDRKRDDVRMPSDRKRQEKRFSVAFRQVGVSCLSRVLCLPRVPVKKTDL